jgi:pimeloyl-ACP methyl ester carboxylesterase
VIAMEYPGYGIYSNQEPSAERILEDAEFMMDYLVKCLGVHLDNIIIMGRSIGSGPAVHIATKYRARCLILISPILSLRKAASEIMGSWSTMFLRERFDNENMIKNILCPVLMLHGDLDTAVPPNHSHGLLGNLIVYSVNANTKKQLSILKGRNHVNMGSDPKFFKIIQHYVESQGLYSSSIHTDRLPVWLTSQNNTQNY